MNVVEVVVEPPEPESDEPERHPCWDRPLAEGERVFDSPRKIDGVKYCYHTVEGWRVCLGGLSDVEPCPTAPADDPYSVQGNRSSRPNPQMTFTPGAWQVVACLRHNDLGGTPGRFGVVVRGPVDENGGSVGRTLIVVEPVVNGDWTETFTIPQGWPPVLSVLIGATAGGEWALFFSQIGSP